MPETENRLLPYFTGGYALYYFLIRFSSVTFNRYSAGEMPVVCLNERLNERIVPKPTSSDISAIFYRSPAKTRTPRLFSGCLCIR